MWVENTQLSKPPSRSCHNYYSFIWKFTVLFFYNVYFVWSCIIVLKKCHLCVFNCIYFEKTVLMCCLFIPSNVIFYAFIWYCVVKDVCYYKLRMSVVLIVISFSLLPASAAGISTVALFAIISYFKLHFKNADVY